MNGKSRMARAAIVALLLNAVPALADDQRRAVPRHPAHPQPTVRVHGQVFIGGYFYDPFFGPYPWWPRGTYPYWYAPVFDRRADVRLHVDPKTCEDAAVYVDGFYAGVVDDFNGVFQSLPLPPGGHSIVLFLDGYRTVRRNLYLRPGSTFTLRATMQKLPAGETSELPNVAPSVLPPPEGSYRPPVTPPRSTAPQPTPAPAASGFGTLDVSVQPRTAEVMIDGQPWVSSEEGHFMVQVTAGRHHVEVRKAGHRPFVTDLDVQDGETMPLNVSLMPGTP
jgi:hypothetical protein